MSDADPVSWFLIQPGWKVLDSEGNDVGKVEEVEGDENADIFNGLRISTGIFSGHRYVPSERVGVIVSKAVHLTLTPAEVEGLTDETGPVRA